MAKGKFLLAIVVTSFLSAAITRFKENNRQPEKSEADSTLSNKDKMIRLTSSIKCHFFLIAPNFHLLLISSIAIARINLT